MCTSETLWDLQKMASSFFTAPTENGDGSYGLLGNSSVDGVFATYCSGFGECLNYGHDYFNLNIGELPESENCNLRIYRLVLKVGLLIGKIVQVETMYQMMRYWIRY